MDWLRWYNGTVTDPKWRVIARRAGVPVHMVIAVWPCLLEAANEASERGTLDHFDAEDVAAALDMEPEQVQAIYDAMQGKVLDGLSLSGWTRRNPKREDGSAERARAWREKQKRERTQPNAGEREQPLEKKREEKSREETATPSPPTERARVAGADALRDYLGPHAGVVERFAAAAPHSATWPAALIGLYGPRGTDAQVWSGVPPPERPACLATAMDEYASIAKPYNARYFRTFLQRVIHERDQPPGAARAPAAGAAASAAGTRSGRDLSHLA